MQELHVAYQSTFFSPFALFIPFANISFYCTLFNEKKHLLSSPFLKWHKTLLAVCFEISNMPALANTNSFQPSRCFMTDTSSWSRWLCRALPTAQFCFMMHFVELAALTAQVVSLSLTTANWPQHKSQAMLWPFAVYFPFHTLKKCKNRKKFGSVMQKVKVCMGLVGVEDVSVWQLFTICSHPGCQSIPAGKDQAHRWFCWVRAEIKSSVILSSLPLMLVICILWKYQWSFWTLLEKLSVN